MVTGRWTTWWVLGGLLMGEPAVALSRPLDAPASNPWRRSKARLLAQVAMPDVPAPEPTAPPPADAAPTGGGGGGGSPLGIEGSSRTAAGKRGSAPVENADVPAPEATRRAPPRDNLLGFGLMVGQPTGLTLQARFLGRHAVVGSVGWDFLYQSLTFSLDYRFTFFSWDFLRYDTVLGFFAGAGVRVGTFEPVKQYLRQLPVTPGFRIPVGATLRLRPLPVELALAVSPVGLDVKEVALAFPRWRPEATLELRADFPFAPF
jgi:hypothetical protein